MAQAEIMASMWEMEITEVETVGVGEAGSATTVIKSSMKKDNTIQETPQMSDTLHAQSAVFQNTMNGICMLQCINVIIWECFL